MLANKSEYASPMCQCSGLNFLTSHIPVWEDHRYEAGEDRGKVRKDEKERRM